jgi:hypothetical protein
MRTDWTVPGLPGRICREDGEREVMMWTLLFALICAFLGACTTGWEGHE